MPGRLRIRVAQTPDGDRQVATILPNGATFMLPPETALAYAFAMLTIARGQFPGPAHLDAAVLRAYDCAHKLIDPPRVQ
jgi:hypothetical protein